MKTAATKTDSTRKASGSQIAFARGAYQPQSEAGLRLLGHELVHVAQSRRAA